MRLEGKVAVVTGAGSGIGQASAVRFAAEGARVAVVDLKEHKCQRTVDMIKEQGGEALSVVADVRFADACERMIESAVEQWGRLDVLFSNAATTRPATATDLAEEDWNIVMDTTLKSVWLGAKYAIPHMRRAGGGSIVNTASVEGLNGDRESIAYCAAKAGVVNVTRCLAVDHAHEKIRANCICPGVIGTPAVLRWLMPEPEQQRQAAAMHPAGRMGLPEEVAALALFLASDESAFITGAAVPIDGGLIAETGINKP